MSAAAPPTPKSISSNFLGATLQGAAYPLRAIGYMTRHRLWRLAAWAVALNAVLFVALVWFSLSSLWPSIDSLATSIANSAESGFLHGIMTAIATAVSWLLGVGLIAIDALVLVLVGQAVASPILEALSERVEAIELGSPERPFDVARVLRSIALALSDLVWAVLWWLAFNLPVFLVGLVLPPVAAAASFAWQALILAQEFVGMPLGRRLVPYRTRFSHIWAERWLSLGFGSVTTLLVVVPVLNLALLPLAAVGGTLAYCDLVRAGRLPRAPLP